MITIKGLEKEFRNKAVLRGIDLEVEEGAVQGIVGKNGSGKTTLFRCIADLESYKGEIGWDQGKIKDHCGLLPTHPFAMSRITGWEYLKLLCTARGIRDENFEEQDVFDLPLGQYVSTYSTGMMKKLAFLGILLQKNRVFLLDEPFNGVDLHSNLIISELIQRLKGSNKTVLISSHLLTSLGSLCDEILLLESGRIEKRFREEELEELQNEMQDSLPWEKIDRLDL